MKRALDNPEYEPPVRDPKAIRNTVLILVGIMLLGGLIIIWKYQEKMAEDHAEVVKGRSAMSLGHVKTNYQTKSLDGKIHTFNILENKVTLIAVVSVNLQQQSQIIIDEMKLAAKHFEDQKDFQLVCISADPESEVTIAQLNEFAQKTGFPTDKKNWFMLTADHEGFGGYIKDSLKLGMISKRDKETKERVLPDLLRIVDPNTNIRGAIEQFRFIAYHADRSKAKEILDGNPSQSEKQDAQEVYDNILSYQRGLLYKYVSYIFEHEEQDANFSEKNNSNRYNIPMMVFGGFILFILFMGYRVKKNRA